MTCRGPFAPFGVAALALLGCAAFAGAHGILGDRFFPPTLSTDDPFAVDEFAFPTVSWIKNAGAPSYREIDAGFEFDKEIFPHVAVGVSDTFIWQKPHAQSSVYGWTNVALTAKYELWRNPEHEAIISVGFGADLGYTGSRAIGRDAFTTLSPRFFFGKGLGDLPDSVGPLRPFAVTGKLENAFYNRGAAPNSFGWDFAVEYSLPYLQSQVRDIGLRRPCSDLIPLVEFSMSTQENRPGRGITTGTINPGVLYENDYFQLGVEASIPVNRASGSHVGLTLQMWVYIDDIFPRTFGHPLFGEHS